MIELFTISSVKIWKNYLLEIQIRKIVCKFTRNPLSKILSIKARVIRMNTSELKYLFLMIIIFIAACIETDIYLPAFADMMNFFSISEEEIQKLLTWNFFGICISCPFYGPISDSIGRKKPLLVALGLFLMGSLMTLWAQHFTWMLWGRLLQGLGSGGCFTLGTAIIFDSFRAQKAVQAINQINTIVPFIMAAAPMLGGYLNHFYGFRSNFLAIAFLVLISFVICVFFFEEPLIPEKRTPLQFTKIVNDFKRACLSCPFWQLTVVVSLLFAGYLAFLSTISVLFVIELGVSKQALPWFQGSLLGIWLMASLTAGQIIKKWGSLRIKIAGTLGVVIGGLGFIVAALFTPQNPYLLTLPMIIYTFGTNWIQGLYFPEGMEILPDIKGITASLLTSTRLLITALIIGLGGHFYNATIFPIAIIMIGIILIVLTLIILYERSNKSESVLPDVSISSIH
jgi:DHA1 family bicyclomycin/chloramphenicol resistance-like MFS transporter